MKILKPGIDIAYQKDSFPRVVILRYFKQWIYFYIQIKNKFVIIQSKNF